MVSDFISGTFLRDTQKAPPFRAEKATPSWHPEFIIECDENGHSYYDNESEIKREKYIRSKGYRILRYDTRENNMLGFIGKISNDLCTNFHT